MWAEIMEEFSDSPSQARIVKFMLENGFGVNESGKVVCNGIPIPATQIAAATSSDRRVVDATVHRILGHSTLGQIFLSMQATPDLSKVAGCLGLTVITVIPVDASRKGIVGAAVKVLTDHDLTIRQIFVTDPYFVEAPRLVIIIEGTLPPGTIEELRALPETRHLII
jgi:predicted regulator of amino acid metabolism with ACT domain